MFCVIAWLWFHILYSTLRCETIGCFAIDLDQVSLQVIFTKQIVQLVRLCPDGRSFVGQLRQYAVPSLLACATVQGVHRRFVQ